jgi:type I restriction enzyme S subunit
LLGKEQQTKEIAEKSLAQIDTLKKTILTRAFRGELGTNNPQENNK